MAQETEDFHLDINKVTKGITEVLSNPSRGKYFIAVDNSDELMAMLLTIPEWSDWRAAEVWWIHSVYVLPKFRGKKVYKKMYLYLKKLVLESDHIAGIRLYVDKRNTSAAKVYEALGMDKEHYSLYEWLK